MSDAPKQISDETVARMGGLTRPWVPPIDAHLVYKGELQTSYLHDRALHGGTWPPPDYEYPPLDDNVHVFPTLDTQVHQNMEVITNGGGLMTEVFPAVRVDPVEHIWKALSNENVILLAALIVLIGFAMVFLGLAMRMLTGSVPFFE